MQGSHFSAMTKFHYFSMIFPWVFTNFQENFKLNISVTSIPFDSLTSLVDVRDMDGFGYGSLTGCNMLLRSKEWTLPTAQLFSH